MPRHYYAIAHTYSGNMRNRDGSMIGQVYAFDTHAGRAAWIATADNPTERGWHQELKADGLTVRKARRDDLDGAPDAVTWHAEAVLANEAAWWAAELAASEVLP